MKEIALNLEYRVLVEQVSDWNRPDTPKNLFAIRKLEELLSTIHRHY
jgi:hypothetical protein